MKFLITIRYLIEFFLFRIIFFLLNFFPRKISFNIFSNTFMILGRLSKYNKIAKDNCKIVFSDFNDKEIAEIINNTWKNLGKNLYELNYLTKLINDKRAIKIIGLEKLEKIKSEQSPVIFFSIHSGNWEICVPILDKYGCNTGAIYRHINNSLFDKFVFKKRTDALKTNKSFYTPKGKVSAKEILEGVINNKSIFLLVDQKDSAGRLINFFGKKVKTQTGFLKIARKYNLKIMPMKNIRLPDNTLQITFEEPLEHNKNYISDDQKMLEINCIVERWIKENPENWFWQHKRFN
ncbi:lysophospholipid acyltransferase family protein [Pelagibacteraceae bacterium]|nr:lysophospholipid acyltransferase family protein [Pelagibacteraceae bacterium]